MCFLCKSQGLVDGAHAAQITNATSGSGQHGLANYIDALTEGLSWGGNFGVAATAPFSFGASFEGGVAFSSAQEAITRTAMQEWANVANIRFTEVSASQAMLGFSVDDLPGYAGLATYYYSGNAFTQSQVQLDVDETDVTVGSYTYKVILHELGHAIGLKHPGNYSESDTGPFLSTSEDTYNASLMSYNPGDLVDYNRLPITPMIYDIAAAQYLYGANTSYNSGDNNYTYSGGNLALAVWDGGGTDTINASGNSGSHTIDLNEGLSNVTTIGSTVMWMAFGANIENAVGGASGDRLVGNSLSNALYGYGSGDTIDSGSGNDTIYGGTGLVDTGDGSDLIYGGLGADSIYGNTGNDTLYGGRGIVDTEDSADLIYGGGGSDQVFGNTGNDSVYGGGSGFDPNDGADLVYGGGGTDQVYGNGGDDTLYGGGSGYDPNDGGDTVYGGAGNDTIYGNGGDDVIYGNENDDVIYGGAGNDRFYFGTGSGIDTLMQFDNPGVTGGDMIYIGANVNGNAMATVDAFLAAVSYANGNAVLDLGGGSSITITGVASGSLTVEDFGLA